MALQTREVQAAKTTAAQTLGQRVAIKLFRNRRPLALVATGALTAIGFAATGVARPDIALLLNTGCSLSNAKQSLDLHLLMENAGYKRSSINMLSTAVVDMANMVLSFLPFLSWVHKSDDYVKDGFGYLAVLVVTSVSAQALERRADFNLLRDKFNSVFHHMDAQECAEYLKELDRRERSWWRKPYWMLNPNVLQGLQNEKKKVCRYMKDREQCKSL